MAADNGEALVLTSFVPFGPNPSVIGARALFSRTAAGWGMKSIVAAGATEDHIEMSLFSPDLSQVAFRSETQLNAIDKSSDLAFEAGAVGGPYAPVANVPREEANGGGTVFVGASADFSHVLFDSVDHTLELSSSTEEAAAKATASGALDVYDWEGGHLQLVNARKDGSLVNQCGAVLGAPGNNDNAVNAVSQDGSTVFFTTPGATISSSGSACEEPERLWMRRDGGEPIEVSAPELGVHPSRTLSVRYNYATPDGEKVFFDTATPLTGETAEEEEKGLKNKLFEYDVAEPEGKRLRRIVTGAPEQSGEGLGAANLDGFFFAEASPVVYEIVNPNTTELDIYRDNTSTEERTLIATPFLPSDDNVPSYVTPNGEFLLYTADLVEGNHEEMFRYDDATGSDICVTCGEGPLPAEGHVVDELVGTRTIHTPDDSPVVTQISDNGQEVFFQTTARLVPQDTNSTSTEEKGASPGLDVYEWEANGAGGCGKPEGCTYMLSAGETSGPSYFLGMSKDGRNVFLSSATRLTPEATPEFTNIYDARVNGGFLAGQGLSKCLSCQGVGSPPPLFSPGASLTFSGTGNIVSSTSRVTAKKRTKCPRRRTFKRGKCLKIGSKRGRYAKHAGYSKRGDW